MGDRLDFGELESARCTRVELSANDEQLAPKRAQIGLHEQEGRCRKFECNRARLLPSEGSFGVELEELVWRSALVRQLDCCGREIRADYRVLRAAPLVCAI